MNLRSIFKRNVKHAKVETTLMIKLTISKTKSKQAFDTTVDHWKKYNKAHKVQNLLYKFEFDKDNNNVAYFSPRTLDVFLNYFKKIIDSNTTIPHTNGTTINSMTADLEIIENNFKQDKNQMPISDSNGRPVLDHTVKCKGYPHVKFDNNYTSILLILNTLLFFSYTDEDLDNIKNLHNEYSNDYRIAKLITKLYQVEVADTGKPKLTKGQLATIPNFKNFSKQNKNAVYIPNLTPKQDIKRAISNKKKDVHQSLDSVVGDKEKKQDIDDSIQHQRKIAMLDKLAGKNRYSRESTSLARSSKLRAEVRSSDPKRSARSKATSKSNARARMLASLAKGHKSTKASSSVASSKSSSASNSQSQSVSSSASSVSSSSQNSKPSSVAKSQSNSSVASKATSSSKAVASVTPSGPLMVTNDANTLARSIKLLLNDKSVPVPIKFQKFTTDKDVSAPASISNALKTGDLDNQRYVQIKSNEFKQVSNQLISQKQNELRLAFKRTEIHMITNAHDKLARRIQTIINKYSDDTFLQKSAARFYNQHYNARVRAYTNERNKRFNLYKQQLRYAYQSNLEKYLSTVNMARDNSIHKYENLLNDQTIKLFNDSRSRRNKDVKEEIQLTKKEANRQLNLQLRNARIEFQHRANEASESLFDFLNRELEKSNGQWISTASKLVKSQVRLDNAKARLNQAKIDANNSKNNKHRRAKLFKAMEDAQHYANEAEDKYSQVQDKLIKLRGKISGVNDEKGQYKFKLSSLKEQLANAKKHNSALNSSTQKSISDMEAHNTKLQNKLNDLTSELLNNRSEVRSIKQELKQARSANQLSSTHSNTEFEKLQNEANVAKQQVQDAQNRQNDLENQKASIQQRLNTALSNQGMSASEASQAQSSAVASAISSTIASMNAQQALSASHNSSSNAAIKGRLQGLSDEVTQSQQTINALRKQVSNTKNSDNQAIDNLIAKTNRQSVALSNARSKADNAMKDADRKIRSARLDAERKAEQKITQQQAQAQSNPSPAPQPKPSSNLAPSTDSPTLTNDFGGDDISVGSNDTSADTKPKVSAYKRVHDDKLDSLDKEVKQMKQRERERDAEDKKKSHRHLWNL